jgi:very-short-patch-repair endonuclease
MKYLYNNQDFKEKRRILRKSQTDAERKLWQILRSRQVSGLKFFRQYSIGDYILDFYCPAIRLAIEVDGSQHIDNKYDDRRTKYLQSKNIFVLRFWNNDVLNNLDGVYRKIVSVVGDLYS